MKLLTSELLLSSILTVVHSWVLESTHTNVDPEVTNDVELKCHFDNQDNDKPTINVLTRMRMFKLDDGQSWQMLADTRNVASNKEYSVTYDFDPLEDAFLALNWATAVTQTIGSYKCEVNGFDAQDNFIVVKTLPVDIQASTKKVNELDDELEKLREMSDKNHEALRKMIEELKGDLDTFRDRHDKENLELVNEIDSFRANLTRYRGDQVSSRDRIQMEIESSLLELRQWPVGPVAIPAPEDGCPETLTNLWLPGYVSFSLSPDSLPPLLSGGNHLMKPVFEKNDSRSQLYLRYCTKQSKFGLDWPRGSYCIHTAQPGVCPSHFKSVSSKINVSSSDVEIHLKDVPLYSKLSADYTFTMFCCRDDGNVDIPILLPIDSPFYLYRLNGKCQAVHYAEVRNEWMTMVNKDVSLVMSKWDQPQPDMDPKNGRLELCYYKGV